MLLNLKPSPLQQRLSGESFRPLGLSLPICKLKVQGHLLWPKATCRVCPLLPANQTQQHTPPSDASYFFHLLRLQNQWLQTSQLEVPPRSLGMLPHRHQDNETQVSL